MDPSSIHLKHLQHPIISPEMASEYDSEVDEAVDHGSVSSWKRCLVCGTDLELEWPHLSEVNPSGIKNHARDEWTRGAELGCSFCNIVFSVINDAGKRYGCSIGDQVKDFQVFLGLNESTGRYLLALEYVWMPLLVEPGHVNRAWGSITVYLDGKPPHY